MRAGIIRLNPSNFTNIDFTTPNRYQGIEQEGNEESQIQSVVRNKQKLIHHSMRGILKKFAKVHSLKKRGTMKQTKQTDVNEQTDIGVAHAKQTESADSHTEFDVNQRSEITVEVDVHKENSPDETNTDDGMDIGTGDRQNQVDVD